MDKKTADDAFRERMTDGGEYALTVNQCISCKHWIRGQRCHAFEGDIPKEITWAEFDHTKPHPLDNGLRYEEAPDVAPTKG